MERHEAVTQVIFHLNLKLIGEFASQCANNLVVVEIPEGVERIGSSAFGKCSNLTPVSFPTSMFCSSVAVKMIL